MAKNGKPGGMSGDVRKAGVKFEREEERDAFVRNFRTPYPVPEGVEITCPHCRRHVILKERIERVMSAKLRCSRCGHRF